jgi:beta-ureidopropionase / N-carbamoyl-L-amino-acid hydrolase
MGSHIDTVATGGAFDGTLGVLGGIEVMRTLNDAGVECHIEQGPILADAGVDIGIVEGVQSISWQRLTIRGEAAHAGTTPIASRHDTGLVAASVVVEARRMCDSGDFGQLRATVGNFDLGGQTNVIPHEATLTIDLRNPDDDLMTAAEQHLAGYVDELAAEHGVEVAWERMAKTAVVPFHPGIQQLLAATADDLGLPHVRAMSGAGHDAQEISAICPTAMVFVAGENGGISHTPREYSTPGPCANGTDVLANAILRLADQP